MADLTNLADAKAWLTVSGNADDALLTRLISASSDYIQTWLSRDISLQPYVSTRNGTGGKRMMFKNYPVASITYLKIDGTTIPLSTNGANGYVSDTYTLMLIGYTFTRGYQNVELSYTAGYASVPKEIAQACIELVALRYKDRDHISMVSKSIGGEVVTYSQKDMSDSIKTTLSNYKKVISL